MQQPRSKCPHTEVPHYHYPPSLIKQLRVPPHRPESGRGTHAFSSVSLTRCKLSYALKVKPLHYYTCANCRIKSAWAWSWPGTFPGTFPVTFLRGPEFHGAAVRSVDHSPSVGICRTLAKNQTSLASMSQVRQKTKAMDTYIDRLCTIVT